MSNKLFLIKIINNLKGEKNSNQTNWRGTMSNWIKC